MCFGCLLLSIDVQTLQLVDHVGPVVLHRGLADEVGAPDPN